MYDYFYGAQADQFSFYRVPKVLFTNDRFREVSSEAKILYIIRDMDDDAATVLMVDSNLQRESILPSERAFAYKMKLEAMKHQGERTAPEVLPEVLFPQTDAGYHYQAPRTVAAKAPAGPGTLSINVLLPDINRKPP